MEFSLMFFSNHEHSAKEMSYQILLDATQFADEYGFKAVWTPERHFTKFGGLYPNPALMSAALATVTKKIQIRGGSVISPLHNIINIFEDWSVVDNLSKGRIGISFGSGWNKNDFILNPSVYTTRYEHMYNQIKEFKDLWQGNSTVHKTYDDESIEINVFPSPYSSSVPLWLSISSFDDAFRYAGLNDLNVLTHLVSQDYKQLEKRIKIYRSAREEVGLEPSLGVVTLMLHTYIADDDAAREKVMTKPFKQYLREIISMGGVKAKSTNSKYSAKSDDLIFDELTEISFNRYIKEASLIGSTATCVDRINRLSTIGVDEIACLIDFGIAHDDVMQSLKMLNIMKAAKFCATNTIMGHEHEV